MRARHPEADGYVERDGVRIFYEVFGTGEPTILMLPTWSVLHAAHGRFQIADLALVAGAVQQAQYIDHDCIEQVAFELPRTAAA